jgi:hypothetical protein
MDWDRLFRKYVWDDQKTPYFVSVGRLTRVQADFELRAYMLFLGTLFSVVMLASAARSGPHGAEGVAFYAFTVVCATVLFAYLRWYPAALYLGATPLAVPVYVFFHGFPARLDTPDHVAIGIFVLLWLRYSVRVTAIARAYPRLPGPPPEES